MENTLQQNSKTVAGTAAVVKLQKRMAKTLLSFCILLSMLMGINVMGYAQNSTQPAMQKTCSITKGGAAVNFTVAGQLPADARVSATAVTRTMPNGRNALGAYDITISKGRSTWQPAAGQPVQVTISDPSFNDGTPLTVYHEGTNGMEFVANVTAINHTITFPARSFSVYVVGEEGSTGDEARLKVNFHQVGGNVVTIYVKRIDMTSGTPAGSHFNQIVYDPGTGTLPTNTQFRGWIQNKESYVATDTANALNINDIRDIIKAELADGVAEGDELDFYAMAFRSFLVTYIDDRASAIGSHDVLIPMSSTETSASYTVDMSYTPSDVEHVFLGWQVNDGGSNIAGHEDGRLYRNDTTIVISGDVVFGVNAPEGHWLVFNENGKGATYNAPQFVLSGQNTYCPELAQEANMKRNGYTFGGWYTNAACTGDQFEFGHPITERTTIFAKWTAKPTATYTVIIWKQNISGGDAYDFEESVTLTDNVNTTISTVTTTGTGNDRYAIVNGVNKRYTGFHVDSLNQNVTIVPEGNAVVNVYYGRNQHTLTFQTQNWSGRWTTRKTITALYGQSIISEFPITGYEDYNWSSYGSNIFNDDNQLTFLDIMPDENTVFRGSDPGTGNVYPVIYYVEALPTDVNTVTFNGKQFVPYMEIEWHASGGLSSTKAEDFVDLLGFKQYDSEPSFGSGNTVSIEPGVGIKFYYLRKVYPITYFDGTYVSGRDVILSEPDQGELHKDEGIAFNADISSYNNGGADYYTPDAPEGFVFEGWYLDKACLHPYTFTTMPEGGVRVYAKWRQIEYRVFLHPNTGHDLSLDWGSDNQAMAFRIAYGDKVSAPTGLRNGYEFVGWYTDPGFTETFNADAFVLNESTVTTPYDKTAVYTDSINMWGEVVNPLGYDHPINKDVSRTWITKKLDLYAKWRATVDGAQGIHLQYDVTSCTPGGAPAPNDTRFYQDNVTAVAGAAPTSIDLDNYVFSHWQVQQWDGTAFVDVPGDTVFPGAKFIVKKDYAKIEVTHWVDPNHLNDTVAHAATGTTATIDTMGPDAPYTKIAKATYTIQLKAVYIPVEKATPSHITWFWHNDTRDTLRNDDPVGINEAVEIPAAPNRTGYNFLGWYKAEEDNPMNISQSVEPNFLWYNKATNEYHARATFDSLATHVAADERTPYDNLFAVWRPITYTVRFNANGGNGTMALQNFTYDEEKNLTANVFTRENYCYQGWSLTADGNVIYNNQQSVKNLSTVDKDTVDLYAVWTTGIEPEFAALQDSYCYGDETVTLPTTDDNGITGTWSFDGGDVSVINTTNVGEHIYTFTPETGQCAKVLNKAITVNPKANAEITVTKNNLCEGDSTTLSVAEAKSYAWSTGATTQSITVKPAVGDTTISVTVIAEGGCQAEGDTVIKVFAKPVITRIDTNDERCNHTGSIVVTVSGGTPGTQGYQYILNDTPKETTTSNSFTFEDLSANHDASSYDASGIVYTFTVKDSLGCTATDSAIIKLHPAEFIDAPDTAFSFCSGFQFAFKPIATTDPILYTWDADLGSCLEVEEGGEASYTDVEHPKTEVTGQLFLKEGCTSPATASYTIHPQYGVCKLPDVNVEVGAIFTVRPPVSMEFTEVGTVCSDSTVSISLTLTNAEAGSTLKWTIGTETVTQTTTDAATYTQSFTMPHECTATVGLHVDYLENNASSPSCDASDNYDFTVGIPEWDVPELDTTTVSCVSEIPDYKEITVQNITDGCGRTLEPYYVSVTPEDYKTSVTCKDTVDFKFGYKDCANNEKFWTSTYIVTGPAKPTISLVSGIEQTADLGCNPSIPEFDEDDFVVVDACKTDAKAKVTTETPSSTTCERSKVWIATYVNDCGVKADTVRIIRTWKVATKPILTSNLTSPIEKTCNWNGSDAPTVSDFSVENTGDLCNPSADVADITISTAGPVDAGACGKTQTWSAIYENACHLTDTVEVTVNWPFDTTKPTIAAIPNQPAEMANCKYTIPDLKNITIAVSKDGCSDPEFVSQDPEADAEYTPGSDTVKVDVVVKVQDACGNVGEQTVKVIVPPIMNMTITAGTKEWTYDGDEHKDSSFTVTLDGTTYNAISGHNVVLNNGDVLGGVTISGAITDVGTETNEVNTGYTVTRDGNDVTCFYDITPSNGTLKITSSDALKLECGAEDKSKTYDGSALSYEPTPSVTAGTTVSYRTYNATDDTWSAYSTTAPSITNVSESPLTVRVKAENSNYEPDSCEYTLTINKAQLTLVSKDTTKEYDGIALDNDGRPLATETGWISGEGATYNFTGSQLDVGQSDNSFEIVPNPGTDTNNYTILKTFGTLTVTKNTTVIDLTAKDNEKVYDGTELTDGGYTYDISKLATTDTIVAVVVGSQTPVGESVNEITEYHAYRGMKTRGTRDIVDVTDNYTINPINGTLRVTCRNIKLTSASDSKTYDGNPLSAPTVTFSGDGFVNGDTIICSNFNSITNVDETAEHNNTFDTTWTGDKANYCVTIDTGKLTILPLEGVVVTITEHSAEYDYDGTPKTVTGYDVTNISNTLYTTDDFSYIGTVDDSTVTKTEVGHYDMDITDADFQNNNTNFKDVTFTIVDGYLDIYPQLVIPTTIDDYVVDVTCYGKGDGQLNLPIEGGKDVTPYKYSYNLTGPVNLTGNTNSPLQLTNLKPGDYSLTITDALESAVTATFTVNQPDTMVATLTVPASTCPNQATYPVNVTVAGGNDTQDDCTYAWGFDATDANAASTTVAMAGTNDCGHEYTVAVKVTDTKGCEATDTTKFTPVDNEDPDFTVPADLTICRAADGTFGAGVTVTGEPDPTTFSDNCTTEETDFTVAWNDLDTLPASDLGPRVIQREWTVTDLCNNSTAKIQKITVNPTAVVNDITSQTVCNGENTTAVEFGTTNTGGTMRYAWTNDTPGIGLDATGEGDIAAFTAVNNGTAPVVATIEVTPYFKNNDVECSGPAKTFTITVNPTAVVNDITSQTVCNGENTTEVEFGTTNTGGTMRYAWTNNTTSIGLAASGEGNIAAFTAENNGTAPVVATITVTPYFKNNDVECSGPAKTFTITVNPKVVMDTPDDQTICDREEIAPVTFTTTLTGGEMSYAWTSSNTTTITGLTSPGTGDIPATALTNTTAEVQTTTITVTPTYTNGGVSCDGDPVTFTITVKPSATGMEDLTAYIKCNGDAFTATPTATSTGKIPAGTQYTWTVTENTDVTGYSNQTTPVDAPISQNLTNNSNTKQTVVYNVTPVTDGCNGETFTISVEVEPTPELVLNCPADVEKVLDFGECVIEILPSELGEPTWTHSLGWTDITITNDAPADNMYPEGDHIVTWTMKDECGNTATCQQHVKVTFPDCPDATDKDGNVYHSVHIDCDCWTDRNLESLTYPDYASNHTTAHDNAGAAIPGVYNYTSPEYPNTTENVTNFGRLYDWPSVINGGQLNDYGHVQGICPDGWYVPTAEKYAALDAHGADALKDSRFWLDGGGSNTTGFSSLPGGYYDGSIQRYLNLMGEAYYWSTTLEGGVPTASASSMRYNCESVINADVREGLGYSVRCVKEKEN